MSNNLFNNNESFHPESSSQKIIHLHYHNHTHHYPSKSKLTQTESLNKDTCNLPDKIKFYFSIDEIKEICFELGIGYEELEHNNLIVFSLSLTMRVIEDGNMNQLIKICQERRPHISWEFGVSA